MPSFVDVPAGKTPAAASDIQQVIDALKGTIGKGIPLSPTAVNDAIAYAFSAKNLDATNSRAGIFYKADGSVLLQIDKNGVQASPDGSLAAAPVLTTASSIAASQIAAAAWTAFTPTLTQGVALTLSSAVGRYMQIGKTVIASVNITVNSAGTAANAFTLAGLPVASAQHGIAAWGFYGTATTNYTPSGNWASATSFRLISNAGAGFFGVSPAVTAAAGDALAMTIVYEAA